MKKAVEKNVQYKLNLSPELYNEMQKLAIENHTTVAELMREGIKFRLLLGSVERNEGRVLIESEKGAEPIQIINL